MPPYLSYFTFVDVQKNEPTLEMLQACSRDVSKTVQYVLNYGSKTTEHRIM